MNEREICINYKYAKYPKEQIRIEAQLNDCSVSEIKKILIKYGYYKPPVNIRLKLYNKGLTDRQIAIRLKLTTAAIHHWRKMNNLPNKNATERINYTDYILQGMTIKQIADLKGKTYNSVYNWVSKHIKDIDDRKEAENG